MMCMQWLTYATNTTRTLINVLQSRLEGYAISGSGTIAEAVFTNDMYWQGQDAHEQPSGSRSEAAKAHQRAVKAHTADTDDDD
jgi:hypothetical protein